MRFFTEIFAGIMLGLVLLMVTVLDFSLVLRAFDSREGSGLFAIAAAILTGLLVVAFAIYAGLSTREQG